MNNEFEYLIEDKMENLICGCGGKIGIYTNEQDEHGGYYGSCSNDKCPLSLDNTNYDTETEAIAAFKKATRADMKQGVKWILVTVRLPERYLEVLVLTVHNNYFVASWNGDTWYRTSDHRKLEVTHWAEINLPEKEQTECQD